VISPWAKHAGHDVGSQERDCIDGTYIAKIMAKDWGFCWTTTVNLKRTSDALPNLSYVKEDVRTIIDSRIMRLLGIIDQAPKSAAWKMRAKIGTRKKWYRDVDSFFEAQGHSDV
jgi:hypothetical protein